MARALSSVIGFLEDRQARSHTGPNWLFFGEQRQATDFYCRQDLEAYQASGHLDRLGVVFSRDQRNKIYVQGRMREDGPRLWQWLQDGAHFYVCGDAGRTAKDVDQTLKDIAATHGGLDRMWWAPVRTVEYASVVLRDEAGGFTAPPSVNSLRFPITSTCRGQAVEISMPVGAPSSRKCLCSSPLTSRRAL
jgi:hypothetical protein